MTHPLPTAGKLPIKTSTTNTHIHIVGSSSSASSSDDEVKEAFEGYSCVHQSSYAPPQYPSYSWTLPKDSRADKAFMWNPDPFVANRPVKVTPIGHKKPKFFAQMSASHSERPHLDFNKMQHSKRLIMVSFFVLSVLFCVFQVNQYTKQKNIVWKSALYLEPYKATLQSSLGMLGKDRRVYMCVWPHPLW